ncbi:MAG: DsbA family protein [Burkholderiales bacterium]
MKQKHKEPEKKQDYFVIFAGLALIVAVVAGAIYYKSQTSKAAAESYQHDRATFVREYSPSTGSPDAKVEIVEFFDPACDTCKEFYPMVKQLMDDHPGKIRLVERYAPFHNGSIPVVKILAAAHMQGKFWPTLEAVFAAQSAWAPNHHPQPDLVWNYIGGVGLDMARLRRDIALPVMDEIVQRDLADAQKLNVSATPEFFVNGKPLPTWGWQQLKSLVESELSAAY